MSKQWTCAGCGIESPDRKRSCDCPTNVVTRDKGGKTEGAWKLDELTRDVAYERERCDRIVREEWHRAVKEFRLPPGTPAEKMSARILTRIRIPDETEG